VHHLSFMVLLWCRDVDGQAKTFTMNEIAG